MSSRPRGADEFMRVGEGTLRSVAYYVSENGILIFLAQLVRRVMRKLRAYIYRSIFVHKVGELGKGAFIRGIKHIRVGRSFRAGNALWLEAITSYANREYAPYIRIGDDVAISDNVHISAINGITIGDCVLMGSRIYIGDNLHGMYSAMNASSPLESPAARMLTSRGPIVIGSRVWIGDGAVILGGVSIGDGAVVAANAVVTRDVDEATIVVGIPARAIKKFSTGNGGWIREVGNSDGAQSRFGQSAKEENCPDTGGGG